MSKIIDSRWFKILAAAAVVLLLCVVVAGTAWRFMGGRVMMVARGGDQRFSEQDGRFEDRGGIDRDSDEGEQVDRFDGRESRGHDMRGFNRRGGRGFSRGMGVFGVVGFLRDILLIGLVVLIATRFPTVRGWFEQKSGASNSDDSAATAATDPPAENGAADEAAKDAKSGDDVV